MEAARLHDEGTSFTGNFAVGDHLLGDAGSESDSFIIRFGSPVKGFGTQVDSHYIRGPYDGSIELFGGLHEFRRSAGVQSLFIDDFYLARDRDLVH